MKLGKFIRLLVLVLVIILPSTMYGQSPPISDQNWELNTSLSDEFNGSQIDLLKWDILDNIGIETGWTNGSFQKSNSIITTESGNSVLRLRAQSTASTGGVQSIGENYLYGYYEMRAKLPGYLNPLTNLPCSQGFWTAFWAYYQVRDVNNCITAHNEIDIVEPHGEDMTLSGGDYENDAQTNEMGHIFPSTTPCVEPKTTKYGKKVIHNLPPLYENYHKFAAECLSDRVIYYFDDVPINVVYGTPIPTHLMKVVMDNQLRPYYRFNSNTPWPVDYYVDYFHYYQLKINSCGTDATINNNTDLANFQFGVRRNITIGNGSSIISLGSGVNKTFRATNQVILNGNFTVPIGSELNIIPTQCN